MCLAKATLAYGLTVRSSSLVFAADAWTRLKNSFRFFQLVFLRRRSGGLVSSIRDGGGSVAKVPNEVWEEIRYWLVQEEIADAEDAFVRPLLCNEPGCSMNTLTSERILWSDFNGVQSCEECWQNYLELDTRTNFANWIGPTLPNVTTLLADFGLALPSRRPISTDPDKWNDPDALALIAAPSRLTRGDYGESFITARCGGDFAEDEETVINVSFSLPEDIDQRFTRLIRLFHLLPVSSSINRLSSNPESLASSEKNEIQTIGKTSGVKNNAVKRIKPHWKLWIMCKTEW
ncbi:hypothetical protein JCM5350_003942 [Sporobolomyces pararoseus]